MCSVCSKRHPANAKHIHKESSTENIGKSVHILDRQEPKKKTRSESARPISKSADSVYPHPHQLTNEDIKKAAGDSSESLFHILGVLEDEYKEAKTYDF